jgi:hypothetical protein
MTIDNHITDKNPFHPDHIKVVMYFDESHTLANAEGLRDSADDVTNGKSLLDVLCMAINPLRSYPFFAIFLSTNSHLHSLAPSRRFAKSARAREHWESLQAPITEVAFDCSPALDIDPNKLTMDDTSSLEFMAQFGRPL